MEEVTTALAAEPDNPFEFLPVHGEMARRVRAFDWEGTSLGGPGGWSPSLRAALSVCLSSHSPIVIWWGSDYRILYNDAYIPFLGATRHPVALGQPGSECWGEIWPTIGPMLEGVTSKGQAAWSDDGQYFFERDLPREEVYLTCTYGPILAADGHTVEGVFCPCTETTERVVSARRLETLRMLGMQAPQTQGIVAACEHVTGVLAQNRHDVPFAIVYRCHTGSDARTAKADMRFERLASTGLANAPAAHDSGAWPLNEVLRTGRAVDVDLAARGLEAPGGAWPEVCAAARVLPLRWGSDASIDGLIVLGVSPRRPLESAYGTFLDLVAGQTGSALASALAYEQERRDAEIDLARTAFVSSVSHALRTPLALLLGPLEDALTQPDALWPRERVESLHRNALHVQKLVDSLVDSLPDFSRNADGRVREQTRETQRANEKRLLTIIEQLPAGVGVLDPGGKWILSNAAMKRWLPVGIPSMQVEQIPRWRAWDAQGNPVAPDNWPGKRALRGETVMPGLEMRYTDDDGEQHWMRASAAPLRDASARVMGACVVVQDITQLKVAEQALREADRRKDEFLATLAHELRNPLAPIRNGLHILRIAGAGGSRSATQRTHDMLERQLDHMVRLVDDLMEVSRITGGKIELRKEAVELGTVLREAVETNRALIDTAGHRLTVNLPPEPLVLDADPVRLAQMVANLLNNAAKYTDPGGQIWLTAHCNDHGERGRQAVVSIRDSGMGIAPAMLPKVFDLFVQGERAYSRAQGGLGIGLTLVRSLAELHGGTVEAVSEGLGRGSEFVVRLPMAAAAPGHRNGQSNGHGDAPDERPTLPAHTLIGCNILIVDDNRDAADSLGELLALLGAQVRIVRDGPAALAMFDSWTPQVALLDIGMPGMDGYEVARRVRAHPAGARVVLIALTGWGQDEHRRRSKAAGIDFHLVKPVDMRALHQLLIAQVGRQG
ncbi:hybrid sensor histidine kinase/response regulator [Paraburkholderia bannensis]|uniref:hybrid sensor histidine kinase/response regulator n=1 Tax=Paraburkholderia bannensis TaxID=765414 RepID=UPI002AB642D9|nr:ATP-binding protein [Paraburkholderia bannensis]